MSSQRITKGSISKLGTFWLGFLVGFVVGIVSSAITVAVWLGGMFRGI